MLKMDALLSLEKDDELEKTVKQYLSKSLKKESDYLTIINYLEESDNYDLSLEIIDEGLKLHPESYDLIISKAEVLYDKDDDEAIEYINTFSKTKVFQCLKYFVLKHKQSQNIYKTE